jgi:hypothetical protein
LFDLLCASLYNQELHYLLYSVCAGQWLYKAEVSYEIYINSSEMGVVTFKDMKMPVKPK